MKLLPLVERLREGLPCEEGMVCRVKEARSGCRCAEAADEIERLRAALQDIEVAPVTDCAYCDYARLVARRTLQGK